MKPRIFQSVIVDSIASITCADGTIDEREVSAMRSIIEHIVIGATEQEAMYKELDAALVNKKLNHDLDIKKLSIETYFTPGQLSIYLDAIAKTILADEQVNKSEVQMAKKLLSQYNVSEDKVHDLHPALHNWCFYDRQPLTNINNSELFDEGKQERRTE